MVKDFFKRIIVEVIKELISPTLTELKSEIALLREEMKSEIALLREEMKEMKMDIRHLDKRIDDLYMVVVRRDEHTSLEDEVSRMRDDIELLKRRVGI